MRVDLYNGDCLEVMKSIPDGSVDLVLTDPPYKLASGGRKNTLLKAGNTPFTRSGECFLAGTPQFSDWIPEVFRVMRPSSYAFIMTNDRHLKSMWEACESSGLKFCEVLVMDKNTAVPGVYFYKSCEFVLMFRKGAYRKMEKFGDKSVIKVKMPTGTLKKHPTEKPISMLKTLMEATSGQGATVLDCFMGSGSTGIACVNTGRNFIGIELDEGYFKVAQERIQAAQEVAA